MKICKITHIGLVLWLVYAFLRLGVIGYFLRIISCFFVDKLVQQVRNKKNPMISLAGTQYTEPLTEFADLYPWIYPFPAFIYSKTFEKQAGSQLIFEAAFVWLCLA